MSDHDHVGLLDEETTEYMRHKKMMSTVFYELRNFEQRLIDMKVAFDDALRANATGVQNVYDKFLEIEARQAVIEDLLKSDHLKQMIETIPTEKTIMKMFQMIEHHPIIDLKESINNIRDDLAELVDRFTF